ncbi:MAG TPA: transporter substrate-binding domain-containing protein [Syntrophorhabdaceae bacterium]|nr:transporter substrate-binding domain-containing protein [Syntrophorhabdaceae bacterium]HQM80084.1 transporter substrate-binding domain-containing protein [Syntrophorhabdaceae bacterium]
MKRITSTVCPLPYPHTHTLTHSHTHTLTYILLVLTIAFFLSATLAGAEERIVRVGVYDNAPKLFVSGSGKPEGIFIDIIEYIAKREGWKLSYIHGTWGESLARLERREIDLMPDVAYTADREKKYSFNKVPVLSSWFQVYSRQGSGIKSLMDLRGKRIAVLKNSVQQEAFTRMAESFGLHITIVAVQEYDEVFESVKRGEADVAVANHFYGALHARKFGLEDTAVVFNPSALYFASRKGNEELLNAIDNILPGLKKDTHSIYYKSLNRWTSEKVEFKLPAWMRTLGIIIGVALIMSIIGAILLKHQVNIRTRELREANQRMEERIIERTAELAAAMEKARAADKLKSAFLATMSHELRTPLNSIIGFTGIILRERVGPLNDEQKKQLNMVRSSSQHLLALINDVLDISKIEAGQLQIAQEDVDVRQVIEKVVQSARPLAENKGIEIGYRIIADDTRITADSRRVEQVLLNLVSNAIKFTEKGSVRITCEADGWNITVNVTDTGIGIKEEDMETIFKTFRQIDSGISRKQEGTGLGLSISKRLVKLMGGSIRVTSVFGSGSTFSFSIPKERKTG